MTLLMASIQCLPFDFRGEAGWACLAAQTQMNRAQIENPLCVSLLPRFQSPASFVMHVVLIELIFE